MVGVPGQEPEEVGDEACERFFEIGASTDGPLLAFAEDVDLAIGAPPPAPSPELAVLLQRGLLAEPAVPTVVGDVVTSSRRRRLARRVGAAGLLTKLSLLAGASAAAATTGAGIHAVRTEGVGGAVAGVVELLTPFSVDPASSTRSPGGARPPSEADTDLVRPVTPGASTDPTEGAPAGRPSTEGPSSGSNPGAPARAPQGPPPAAPTPGAPAPVSSTTSVHPADPPAPAPASPPDHGPASPTAPRHPAAEPPADGPPADGPPAGTAPADGPPDEGSPDDGPPASEPPADKPPSGERSSARERPEASEDGGSASRP